MKNLLSIILIATLFVFTSCQKEELELPIQEVETIVELTIEEPVVEEPTIEAHGIEEVEIDGEIVFICSMPVMEYYDEPTCGVIFEE